MCHWNKALLYDCYCEWCLTSKTAEQKKVCQGCLLVSPVEIISAWDTQWGACRAGGVTGQEVISCDSRIVELTHTIRRNSSPTNMLLNCFSGTNEVEFFLFFKKKGSLNVKRAHFRKLKASSLTKIFRVLQFWSDKTLKIVTSLSFLPVI